MEILRKISLKNYFVAARLFLQAAINSGSIFKFREISINSSKAMLV